MEWVASVLSAVVGVWVAGAVVSRPLQMSFSVTRRLGAGLIAVGASTPILQAITPPALVGDNRPFPLIWYLALGSLLAVLTAMIVLVVAEVLVPSGSLPGPVTVVRSLPARARRARRYVALTRVLARHGLASYVFTRQRPDLGSSPGRARLARSLRAALEDAGVCFVKLGQILATRPDLLPAEFVDELAGLQSQARPVPWPEVEQVLRAELGEDYATGFASVEPEPLAAASVAQVHAAVLTDGRPVVVKVQRPGIAATVAADIDVLTRFAARLQARAAWAARLGVVGLVDGFAASLREELDFRAERRNIDEVAAALESPDGAAGVVRVPEAHPELSTARVLVLERIVGRPVTEAPAAEGERLATGLLEALLGQILVHGVFHADPHPGNLLYDDSPDARAPVVMLDLGSVGRVGADVRSGLVRMLVAVDADDPLAARDVLLELVEAPAELDERRLRRDLGRFLARVNSAAGGTDATAFVGLFRIIADHGLSAPPELAAVIRALGTLDGTLAALCPGFDLVAAARRVAAARLSAGTDPEALVRRAGAELALLLPVLRGLPRRLDRVVGALEDGSLTVGVRPRPGELARPLAAASSQAIGTALAAATGLMAVVLLAGSDPADGATVGLAADDVIGYFLLVISAMLGLRSLVSAYRR